MKRLLLILFSLSFFLILCGLIFVLSQNPENKKNSPQGYEYWLLLERKSNKEYLYKGIPGEKEKSELLRTFIVKSGIPRERPTPLPELVGREYWLITKKYDSKENPETAPYFLELNIPVGEEEPFGPTPYLECKDSPTAGKNGQCNWILPGAFGLHGINGDLARLSADNPGSSGCIRHRDEDITYLYQHLDLTNPVEYYIVDK